MLIKTIIKITMGTKRYKRGPFFIKHSTFNSTVDYVYFSLAACQKHKITIVRETKRIIYIIIIFRIVVFIVYYFTQRPRLHSIFCQCLKMTWTKYDLSIVILIKQTIYSRVFFLLNGFVAMYNAYSNVMTAFHSSSRLWCSEDWMGNKTIAQDIANGCNRIRNR